MANLTPEQTLSIPSSTTPNKNKNNNKSSTSPIHIEQQHKAAACASYSSDCPLNGGGGNSSSSSGSSTGNNNNTHLNHHMTHTKSTKSARDQKSTRNSFFNCIGKHLGCHFLQQHARQHHQHQQLVNHQHQTSPHLLRAAYLYNSQDDLPSSSTDSFSLSYERGSTHTGFHLTGSNIDLTTTGAAAGSSCVSVTATQLAADELKLQKHQLQTKFLHNQNQSQNASRNTLSSASALSGCSSSATYSPALLGSFDVDCLVDIYNGDDEDDVEDGDVCVAATALKMYQQHHAASGVAENVAHSCCSDDSSGVGSSSGSSSGAGSSDEDDECSNHEECCKQQKLPKHQQRKSKHDHQQNKQQQQQQPEQTSATTPTTTATTHSQKRLHLSRLSIASSVSRMLNHFASSTSMRSLSCSSTPLRCFKDAKVTKGEADGALHHRSMKNVELKKNSLPNTLCSSSSSSGVGSRSSSSGSGSGSSSGSGGDSHSSSSKNNHSSSSSSKKKEKKQQSILRPPVHYVYMKGMSGLYSRVPRYTVCSPYAMH